MGAAHLCTAPSSLPRRPYLRTFRVRRFALDPKLPATSKAAAVPSANSAL